MQGMCFVDCFDNAAVCMFFLAAEQEQYLPTTQRDSPKSVFLVIHFTGTVIQNSRSPAQSVEQ